MVVAPYPCIHASAPLGNLDKMVVNVSDQEVGKGELWQSGTVKVGLEKSEVF